MTRIFSMTVAAAALAASVLAGPAAMAQSGRAVAQASRPVGTYFDPSRGEAPPVVIRKGSTLPFTDSGTVAPKGSEDEYFVDQTEGNLPVYSSFRPEAFGNDVLPGRFGEIGRGSY